MALHYPVRMPAVSENPARRDLHHDPQFTMRAEDEIPLQANSSIDVEHLPHRYCGRLHLEGGQERGND